MISFQKIEDLKSELTGKYVVVRPGLSELKRFEKLTGIIKTVNMNGRALVEFDGPVDIGWYDIDPGYLNIVDAPRPKAEKHEKTAAETKPKPAAGKSPLEMARAGGTAPAAAPSTAAAPTEKKLSPLEMARQGAAKPAAAPAAAEGEKKLSPLELARQGMAKGGDAPAKPASTPVPAAASTGDKKLSPLDLIRQQGAATPAATTPPAVQEAPDVFEEKPAAPVVEAPAQAERPADPPGVSKLELAREPLSK